MSGNELDIPYNYFDDNPTASFVGFRIKDLRIAAADCYAEDLLGKDKGSFIDEEVVTAFYNDRLSPGAVRRYMQRKGIDLFEVAWDFEKGLQFRYCHLQP